MDVAANSTALAVPVIHGGAAAGPVDRNSENAARDLDGDGDAHHQQQHADTSAKPSSSLLRSSSLPGSKRPRRSTAGGAGAAHAPVEAADASLARIPEHAVCAVDADGSMQHKAAHAETSVQASTSRLRSCSLTGSKRPRCNATEGPHVGHLPVEAGAAGGQPPSTPNGAVQPEGFDDAGGAAAAAAAAPAAVPRPAARDADSPGSTTTSVRGVDAPAGSEAMAAPVRKQTRAMAMRSGNIPCGFADAARRLKAAEAERSHSHQSQNVPRRCPGAEGGSTPSCCYTAYEYVATSELRPLLDSRFEIQHDLLGVLRLH